jgi:hypothetical protein
LLDFLSSTSLNSDVSDSGCAKNQNTSQSHHTLTEEDLTQARIANEQAQSEYYRKQAQETSKRGMPAWFVPSISAAFSFIGIIASILLSSAIAAHNVELEQRRTYARQKSQVRLSVRDLRAALVKIESASPFPPAFVDEQLIYTQPKRPPAFLANDPYYQKYDLVDTVYRVCALFGWIELYRRDPSFLSGPSEEKQKIEKCFQEIRKAFGDEFEAEKKKKSAQGGWVDGLILNDDQRAIGEKMLEKDKDAPAAVIGYASFCERLFRIPRREDPVGSYEWSQNYWVWNATRFVVEFDGKQLAPDFKRERLRKVIVQLDDLSKVLETN